MDTARALKDIGIRVLRAGLWKPRTHPGSFEGVGEQGLAWLQEAREKLGLRICTEVVSARHVQECLRCGVDLLWIGARTTGNPFLVQEIADTLSGHDIPVLVKNPLNPDLNLWIGALERLSRAGVRKLGVVLRGFSTRDSIAYRSDPGWKLAIDLRTRYPEMAFFVDPSHMAGERRYIRELSQRAMDLGLDGLMIESHCCPEKAWSDASQQLTPQALKELLEGLAVRKTNSESLSYKENIEALRARIDVIDRDLLRLLRDRMEISRQVAACKREHNVAILQAERWEHVLESALESGRELGLSEAAVRAIMTAIHEESVRVQKLSL